MFVFCVGVGLFCLCFHLSLFHLTQLLEKLEKCFLILDSWTNKNNKHLVGVNVLFGGISVNIDAIPMEGGVRETGDHIKERVLAAVKLFPGLDKRIGGVVTDWGKNFRNAASQLVACDELPSCLVEVGCIQHGLNNGLKVCCFVCACCCFFAAALVFGG